MIRPRDGISTSAALTSYLDHGFLRFGYAALPVVRAAGRAVFDRRLVSKAATGTAEELARQGMLTRCVRWSPPRAAAGGGPGPTTTSAAEHRPLAAPLPRPAPPRGAPAAPGAARGRGAALRPDRPRAAGPGSGCDGRGPAGAGRPAGNRTGPPPVTRQGAPAGRLAAILTRCGGPAAPATGPPPAVVSAALQRVSRTSRLPGSRPGGRAGSALAWPRTRRAACSPRVPGGAR